MNNVCSRLTRFVLRIVLAYVFYVFQNPENTTFYVFFEVSCQKNVGLKDVESVVNFSLFSTLKLLRDTFTVKQLHTCRVIHTTIY